MSWNACAREMPRPGVERPTHRTSAAVKESTGRARTAERRVGVVNRGGGGIYREKDREREREREHGNNRLWR
jgi:hypothetical protein